MERSLIMFFLTGPEVVDIVLFSLNDNSVSLNWQNTFRLNGQLRFYVLTRNNFTLRQDILTSVVLANQPRGESKLQTLIGYITVMFAYSTSVLCDSCD